DGQPRRPELDRGDDAKVATAGAREIEGLPWAGRAAGCFGPQQLALKNKMGCQLSAVGCQIHAYRVISAVVQTLDSSHKFVGDLAGLPGRSRDFAWTGEMPWQLHQAIVAARQLEHVEQVMLAAHDGPGERTGAAAHPTPSGLFLEAFDLRVGRRLGFAVQQ